MTFLHIWQEIGLVELFFLKIASQKVKILVLIAIQTKFKFLFTIEVMLTRAKQFEQFFINEILVSFKIKN